MTPEIWKLEDVAKFLRVSVVAAGNLVKESKIPHFRVGDAIRFRKDQIIRLTESGIGSHADALSPCSQSERLRGRTEWRRSRDKQELFVRLGNPHSAISYSLIPLSNSVRTFFPGYKIPFTMETVSGDTLLSKTAYDVGSSKGVGCW